MELSYRSACPAISGHDKIVDQILCVWFCGPKKTFVFGSQKGSIRDGLSSNFGATNQFSPEVQISDCQNWGQKSWIFADFLTKIRMSSELATWTVRETENYSRKPSENYGEYPEESTGVFDRPAE